MKAEVLSFLPQKLFLKKQADLKIYLFFDVFRMKKDLIRSLVVGLLKLSSSVAYTELENPKLLEEHLHSLQDFL